MDASYTEICKSYMTDGWRTPCTDIDLSWALPTPGCEAQESSMGSPMSRWCCQERASQYPQQAGATEWAGKKWGKTQEYNTGPVSHTVSQF